MKRLKNIDYKILFELAKNSKISDRELAKKTGVSQPTISRRRWRLEKEELLEYSIIPNFEKLGFEIMAFNFVSYEYSIRAEMTKEALGEKVKKFLSKHPNMIFASSGMGLGWDGLSISLHKDYSDYAEFIRSHRMEWGEYADKFESFSVSLRSDNIIRPLTLKYLVESIKQNAITH